MGIQIELHEDIVDQLYIYCERSTAEIEMVVERFLKTWWQRDPLQAKLVESASHPRTGDPDADADDYYTKFKADTERLVPDEGHTTGISIDHFIGKQFKNACTYHKLNPIGVASYLGGMFLQARNIELWNEIKDEREEETWGSIY